MAIVRNIYNSTLYRYLGNNQYRNLITGVEGVIEEEKARDILKINLEATYLCEKYPIIEELIKRLNLKADVGSVSGQENG